MTRRSAFILFGSLVSLGIVLDWLSKRWALGLKGTLELLSGILSFETGQNSGVAFGIPIPNSVMIIATPLLLLLLFVAVRKNFHITSPLTVLFAALVCAGALGNFADRIMRGAVIDFIKIPFWPTFNVADMEVVLGIFGLLVVYGRMRVKPT